MPQRRSNGEKGWGRFRLQESRAIQSAPSNEVGLNRPEPEASLARRFRPVPVSQLGRIAGMVWGELGTFGLSDLGAATRMGRIVDTAMMHAIT
jgi:hypothetical protein